MHRTLSLVLGLLIAAPVAAIEDRDNSNKTGWLWYTGQTTAQLSAIAGQGYRIVDLRVQTTSPTLTYTAAFVTNSGTYAKSWWHYYNVTGAQLTSALSTNNARLTCLDVWEDSATSTPRFAAVMVSNTGSESKGWLWLYNTSIAAITNAASTNNARPILIRQYSINSTNYYATVMLGNTGADAKTWWHWYGMSAASLQSHLSTNGARVYDLSETTGGGTFNVVTVKETSMPKSWYLLGATQKQFVDISGSTGSRPISFDYVGGHFNVALVNNSNALETRVSALMRGISDGAVGAYLKKANGSVLANLYAGRVIEPASLLKTLHHVHAMRRVSQGTDFLTSNLTVYTGYPAGSSCPNGTLPVTENLETVLGKMMQNSDNARTLAIATRYGFAALNTTASALGMSNTSVNHNIGCCTNTPNRTTLAEIGELHEAVINGYLGSQRQKFYDLMNTSESGYGVSELTAVLQQESAKVGLTAAEYSSFVSTMYMAYKRGGYGCNGAHHCWGGYVKLPFYTNSGIQFVEYVTGAFVNDATVDADADTAARKGAADVLRDEINLAMNAWKDHVVGSWTSFGTACTGSNALLPDHTGGSVGEPNIGANIAWRLAQAKASSTAVLYIGGSKTLWGAVPLPLSLAGFGANGCWLNVAPTASLTTPTSAAGVASIPATIPNQPAFVGAHVFTQYAVLDLGANALGLAWSRGLDLLIGGQKP